MTIPHESLAPLAERIAWAVIHSLWQGAILAAAAGAVLRALRRGAAALRHAVCLIALLAMLAAVVVTAFAVSPRVLEREILALSVPASAPARQIMDVSSAPREGQSSDPLPTAITANVPRSRVAQNEQGRLWSVRLEPLLPWISAAWLVGVSLITIRHFGGWWRVRELRRGGSMAEGEVQRRFATLIERFGLRSRLLLLHSADAVTPMLTGVIKPIVILPIRVATGLDPVEIESILAHELAHLVRCDAWSNLAQIIVETILFYHPAICWIGRRARIEREHAADDLALERCAADRKAYAGALLRLAELDVDSSLALAATGGHLLNRVRRIIAGPNATATPSGLGAALLVMMLLLGLVSAIGTGAFAQPAPTAPAKVPADGTPSAKNPKSKKADAEQWIADAFQLDDAGKRNAAIERIRGAMGSSDVEEMRAGLSAFVRLGPIEFDKASFRPAVRAALESNDPATRAAAAQAFTLTGVDSEDLPRILALADDPAPEVRDNLTIVIVRLTKADLTGKPASDAILKLMDKLPRDERNVAHALWGSKFSPEIEARVLEFCRDLKGFGVGYNFFYGALSTQANKSEASVKRLIEILADEDTTNKAGRAAWGLQQGVDRAQYGLVADAMVRTVEARSDGYLRTRALACLRAYGSATQAPALRSILAKPGVTGEFRSNLEEVLASVEARPATSASVALAPATGTPATTATPSKPGEKAEIEVKWGGKWWPASVVKTDGERTQVHYVGYETKWDEWVAKDRIRPLNSGSTGEDTGSVAADRTAQLVEKNRRAARIRADVDNQYYTREQIQEIETLYQVANNKGKRSEEAKASLKQLLEKYDKANRTGCATLYLGQASEGEERLQYLTRAVEQFSDCFYFNGCQVGGYGRLVLALTLWERGDKDKARALVQELKTTYKDATDHRGRPMSESAEALEKEFARTP